MILRYANYPFLFWVLPGMLTHYNPSKYIPACFFDRAAVVTSSFIPVIILSPKECVYLVPLSIPCSWNSLHRWPVESHFPLHMYKGSHIDDVFPSGFNIYSSLLRSAPQEMHLDGLHPWAPLPPTFQWEFSLLCGWEAVARGKQGGGIWLPACEASGWRWPCSCPRDHRSLGVHPYHSGFWLLLSPFDLLACRSVAWWGVGWGGASHCGQLLIRSPSLAGFSSPCLLKELLH